MKKYLVSFFLLAAAFSSQAQQPLLYSTQPLKGSVSQVRAETSGGSITIEGGHDTDARLEVYVRRNNGRKNLSKAEAQQLLEENYNLNIDENGRTLRVSARPKRSFGNGRNSLSISYKIFVPTAVSTQLNTSGGSIALAHLSGIQKFSTSGGSLSMESVGETVEGKTSGGSISLKDSKGNIDLVTSGGAIRADHCTGNIRLFTSGGGISAENIAGELYAHTSGGNIHLKDMSCSLDAGTSGGNIDVSVSDLGRYVKLNTAGGNISLDLPQGKKMDLDLSASHVSAGELKTFHGEIKRDKIEGALNGGGIPVEVSATGNINVEFE